MRGNEPSFLRGAWDDPNCARPTRAFSSRALREHGDRPSHPASFFSTLLKSHHGRSARRFIHLHLIDSALHKATLLAYPLCQTIECTAILHGFTQLTLLPVPRFTELPLHPSRGRRLRRVGSQPGLPYKKFIQRQSSSSLARVLVCRAPQAFLTQTSARFETVQFLPQPEQV